MSKAAIEKKFSYSLAEKLDIVSEAYPVDAITAVNKTARKYHVQPQQIRTWKKNFANVRVVIDDSTQDGERAKILRRSHTNKKSRMTGGGRKDGFPIETVQKIRDYYVGRRNQSLSVSGQQLKIEAMRIDPVSCSDLSSEALRQRIARLLDRWDVSYRRSTNVSQQSRFDPVIMDDFKKHIVEYCTLIGVTKENIYNADQTNIPFAITSKSTYAARGSRTVSVRGVQSSSRCTTMLCCSMLANKLPPFIVFKGSRNRTGAIFRELAKKEGYPESVELAVQESAWFDELVMLDWIERVWKPFASKKDEKTFILLDEFKVHLTTKVKEAFYDCNTAVEYIPPGYTSTLQVCDVGINKPFKDYLKIEFDNWMVLSIDDARPRRQDVSNWIEITGETEEMEFF
jgi:DDE superfamily endonuclease